jgi:hypothetical protein
MEVFDFAKRDLVENISSPLPILTVGGLQPGMDFHIVVYAANSKGKSDPTSIHAYTLKSPQKRTGKNNFHPYLIHFIISLFVT